MAFLWTQKASQEPGARENLPESEANSAENRAQEMGEKEVLKILLIHLDPAVPEAVT